MDGNQERKSLSLALFAGNTLRQLTKIIKRKKEMADYIKIKVSELSVGNTIMWRGRVHEVVEKLGPASVKLRRYKHKKVGDRIFDNKWYTISDDIEVDKVSI